MKQIDFSKFDLLTEEGRHSALMEINGHAKIQFAIMGLSEQSLVSVLDYHIRISIKNAEKGGDISHFASTIELYAHTRIDFKKSEWEISGPIELGVDGTSLFDPTKYHHLALKHLNVGILLSNWDKATQLFDFYTSEYRRLKKLISEANNVAL